MGDRSHAVVREAGDDRAVVAARLDYGAHEELLAAFPFPHELEVAVVVWAKSVLISEAALPLVEGRAA